MIPEWTQSAGPWPVNKAGAANVEWLKCDCPTTEARCDVNTGSAPPFLRLFLPAAVIAFSAGCSSDPSTGPDLDPPQITGNAVAGLEAFDLECASCHSTRDGFDLRFFRFPDSTIVRRAVAHVDTATAHDIVAYIRTVRSSEMSRNFRIFQPGGQRIGGDELFAAGVFGATGFPTDLTPDDLAAIDPLDVRIAIDFPLWSFEASNLDWMPDRPIDPALLDYPTRMGAARPYIELYHDTHALDALISGVLALRIADRDPDNPDAPCVMEPFERFRPDD